MKPWQKLEAQWKGCQTHTGYFNTTINSNTVMQHEKNDEKCSKNVGNFVK